MVHNPDHYTEGTRVKLTTDAKEQGLRPVKLTGKIVSPYPINQCVWVKWPHKRSRDCWHVDLLAVVQRH